MTADFRALCEELLGALTTTNPSAFGQFAALEDRARAALAQPQLPAAGDVGELVAEAVKDCLTTEPIPVSERLPDAGDCDDSLCWQWLPDINGHHPLGRWELQHRDWLSDFNGEATHWLPAHALPLPDHPPTG